MIKHSGKVTNVVHESETQRQHIRIELPAETEICDQRYKIKNISAGGVCIRTKKNITFPSGIHNLKIFFHFENFSFHLDVRASLIYYNSEKNESGFAFHEMNARQISLINHVIKSYLSGHIVSEGDIMDVVTRENFVPVRDERYSNDNKARGFLRRFLPMSIIVAIGLTSLFLILGNIYESTSIVKSYMGIVEGETFSVRAQSNGIYKSLLPEDVDIVRKDQPLAVLHMESSSYASSVVGAVGPIAPASTGKEFTILSPCDCLIVQRYAQEGEFCALGDPIFKLMPQNGKTWVTANLAPEQIYRLQLMDDAHIKIAGEGSYIEGNVAEFMAPELDKDIAKVKVKTTTPLPPESLGNIVYVEFFIH